MDGNVLMKPPNLPVVDRIVTPALLRSTEQDVAILRILVENMHKRAHLRNKCTSAIVGLSSGFTWIMDCMSSRTCCVYGSLDGNETFPCAMARGRLAPCAAKCSNGVSR